MARQSNGARAGAHWQGLGVPRASAHGGVFHINTALMGVHAFYPCTSRCLPSLTCHVGGSVRGSVDRAQHGAWREVWGCQWALLPRTFIWRSHFLFGK